MELQQRVRGVVLARVHTLGGTLVRLGEGIQGLARPLALTQAPQAARLGDGGAVTLAPAAVHPERVVEQALPPQPLDPQPLAVEALEPPVEVLSPAEPGRRLEEPRLVSPKEPSRKGRKSRRR